MAFPTILVNSATGTDNAAGAACSGAGPSTALTGTVGKVLAARIGFYGYTSSISGVDTTGLHALYIHDTTAGRRRWGRITAVKDTRQTVNGSIESASSTLACTTTGMTAGDHIKVVGAGAASADLYSTIDSVDSGSSCTLYDSAGTTVSDNEIENPRQVTTSENYTGPTLANTFEWAIGGKLASIGSASSILLNNNNGAAGDVAAGWVIEMESGHTETIAATYNMRRPGSTTDGPVTLRGASGAATMPILTFSNNGVGIQTLTGIIHLRDFELRNSNGTKTASIAISIAAAISFIRGIKITHATDYFGRGIFLSSNNSIVENCIIKNCAGHSSGSWGLSTSSAKNMIKSCDISASVTGILSETGGAGVIPLIEDCIIWGNSADGIALTSSGTWANAAALQLRNCTIHGNTGDGIDVGGSATNDSSYYQMQIINCNITGNGGWGINFSNGTPPTLAGLVGRFVRILNNNFGTGALANTSGSISISGIDIDSIAVDPGYTNAANGIFTCGTGIKALGYPLTNIGGGMGATRSYVDIGAAQRPENLPAVGDVKDGVFYGGPSNTENEGTYAGAGGGGEASYVF